MQSIEPQHDGCVGVPGARVPGDTDEVRISVEDDGPGIVESDHEAIFEKFKQLDASATKEYTGSGLGLAITKDLVQLLGGRVGLESVVGEGSTFYVVLPYRLKEESSSGQVPAVRAAVR